MINHNFILMLFLPAALIGSGPSSLSKQSDLQGWYRLTPKERLQDELQRDANDGDAQSCFALALRYYQGENVEQDYSEAAKWLEKAAAGNHLDAMNLLGSLYAEGKLGPVNNEKALHWWHLASNLSHVEATYNAAMLHYARNERKGYRRSLVLFERASDLGNAAAMNYTGAIYFQGLGVDQNREKALYWFKKGAEAGDADAALNLAKMYFKGLGTEKNLDLADRYFTQAVEAGNKEALFLQRLLKEQQSKQ